MAKKLAVTILWHQHQPYYKDGDGLYQMPWVRFHGTKDYLDMLLVLKEFPEVKQVINLVPSLLLQIQDYVNNGAKDDIWLLTEKPADQLTFEEKKAILNQFFLANVNTMIKPYPRYFELYQKFKWYQQSTALEHRINSLSVDDFRDLQMWYNLTWIGVESRKRPEIQTFFQKGKGFSEADKKALLEISRKILAEIIPLHKEMWDSGQIELSASPFYHPILPLLCDSNVAKESSPDIKLPKYRFQHPEDAETQITRALAYFNELFGRRPRGMWPSEGSVSMQALEIVMRQGVEWVATDEGILARTLKEKFTQQAIYQPYELSFPNGKLKVFFRDHYLSDAIGFVYGNWPADRAVDDLIKRLVAIRSGLVKQYGEEALERFVVPIILDGENCWEYYQEDGKPFLRRLYEAFSSHDLLETRTFSEVLDRNQPRTTLSHIHPGSWINSTFNIWIGSQEDNRSWEVLYLTREFLVEQEKLGVHPPEALQQAWEKIYIAEGSDWNWWYGDEHSSANDMKFDQLYRQHLMQVYQLLGQEVPSYLYQTIKQVHFDRFVSSRPKNFITPVLDGKSSHFYEWVGAAEYDLRKTTQAAMHQVARVMDKLYVGFDAEHLYLRIDFARAPNPMTEFVLAVRVPHAQTIVISPLRGVMEKFEMKNETKEKSVLEPTFKLGEILEVAVRFADLGVKAGDRLGFQVQLKLNGQLLEQYPHINLIEIEVPEENFDLIEWSV